MTIVNLIFVVSSLWHINFVSICCKTASIFQSFSVPYLKTYIKFLYIISITHLVYVLDMDMKIIQKTSSRIAVLLWTLTKLTNYNNSFVFIFLTQTSNIFKFFKFFFILILFLQELVALLQPTILIFMKITEFIYFIP